MAIWGGVTRTCYTKIMNLFSSKILVQPFTGHVFFVFFFFLSIFFLLFFFTLLFLFFFSFFCTFLLIIFFYLCIFFPLLFLTFSYIFFSRIYFILIYLVIFSFLYSHCHRSQTSQVMPCWPLPTTLPHAMYRSDILNFHREYSKMNDAERISTTYIPSNRYLKRKKMDKR